MLFFIHVLFFRIHSFVYVGLYGFSYCEAGSNVMQLFRDRGWEAIIADDIVGMVLVLLSMISGLITCGISIFFANSSAIFDALKQELGQTGVFVLVGL